MAGGILVIDKPAGWTSMDVCAKLRGMFHEKRVGHAGTLDPMATGVLPVFLGRATRAVEFAADSDKEYIAGLKLGVTTNTQDITGEIVEERPADVSREQLWAVLERFTGDIEQVPPMYSAIKIGGKKLYELARKGKEVERRPRPVTIHALGVLDGPERGADFTLRVACSKARRVSAADRRALRLSPSLRRRASPAAKNPAARLRVKSRTEAEDPKPLR